MFLGLVTIVKFLFRFQCSIWHATSCCCEITWFGCCYPWCTWVIFQRNTYTFWCFCDLVYRFFNLSQFNCSLLFAIFAWGNFEILMLVNLDLLTFGGTVSTSLRAETMVDGLPRAYRLATILADFFGWKISRFWCVLRVLSVVLVFLLSSGRFNHAESYFQHGSFRKIHCEKFERLQGSTHGVKIHEN